MKYKVLDNLNFNGVPYEMGSVLETDLAVSGLVNKGLIRPLDHPLNSVDPYGSVIPSYGATRQQREVDPVPPAQSTQPIQEAIKENYPQADLNIKRDIAEVAIRSAADTLGFAEGRDLIAEDVKVNLTDMIDEVDAVATEDIPAKTIKKVANKRSPKQKAEVKAEDK